jgi:FtsZ-binding cell division protein ZapB
MDPQPAPERDSFSVLEERIVQAVELVTRLRQEKETAVAEKLAALQEAGLAKATLERLTSELESLRAEKRQVRSRIERLLGQIDQLSGA